MRRRSSLVASRGGSTTDSVGRVGSAFGLFKAGFLLCCLSCSTQAGQRSALADFPILQPLCSRMLATFAVGRKFEPGVLTRSLASHAEQSTRRADRAGDVDRSNVCVNLSPGFCFAAIR